MESCNRCSYRSCAPPWISTWSAPPACGAHRPSPEIEGRGSYMPKRWAWLGAILLGWASLAAGASDVKVQGLAPNQCEGNLTITITGSSADDFVGAGDRATVELVKSKGPEGVIEGFSTVPYTRSQNVVR